MEVFIQILNLKIKATNNYRDEDLNARVDLV